MKWLELLSTAPRFGRAMIILCALALSSGCSEAPDHEQGDASPTTGGTTSAGGSLGTGGIQMGTGGGLPSGSGNGGTPVGSGGTPVGSGGTPSSSGGTGGHAGTGGSSSLCSEPCADATPFCDDVSRSCKTCTPTQGCPQDKPLCDVTANSGNGECRALEVIAFYTPHVGDLAHESFVGEANEWFPMKGPEYGFSYRATADWDELENITAAPGRIVFFYDNRPDGPGQQAGFEAYMKAGGAFIGFHVSAFTQNPSVWSWYFNELLGSGSFIRNTWRPTSAQLKVEDAAHPVLQGLDSVFTSAPNEWYSFDFQGDLSAHPNIRVLLSIDPSSFPLGTVPNETWQSGYYPVVWTNTNYRMLYINMGHNDMDYGGTNGPLSSTFSSEPQDQLLLSAIRWLGGVE